MWSLVVSLLLTIVAFSGADSDLPYYDGWRPTWIQAESDATNPYLVGLEDASSLLAIFNMQRVSAAERADSVMASDDQDKEQVAAYNNRSGRVVGEVSEKAVENSPALDPCESDCESGSDADPTPKPSFMPTPEPTQLPAPTYTPFPQPTTPPVPTSTPRPEPTRVITPFPSPIEQPKPTVTIGPKPTGVPGPTIDPIPLPQPSIHLEGRCNEFACLD